MAGKVCSVIEQKEKRDIIGVPVSPELRERIDAARSRESGKSAAQFAREAIDARLAIVEASMEVG
jgi:predicted DNA-binding protein